MIKPSGSLANKQTREVRQTYFSLHFSSAFIRNAHILYLMPLYISVVKRGGGGVKWAFAREPEPEPERVREHELLYMGGGGTVGMGWGDWGGGLATDLRTYLLIHAGIWNHNWVARRRVQPGVLKTQNTVPSNSNCSPNKNAGQF